MKETVLRRVLRSLLLVIIIGTTLLIWPDQTSAAPCTAAMGCEDPNYSCIIIPPSLQGTCVCNLGTLEVGWPGGYDKGTSICSLVDEGGGSPSGVLGALINSLVVAIIALVVMASMVTIVIGGYIYMTAMGSADRVRQSKVWIGSALLGIFLALAAYTILNFINPSLVSF